MLGVPSDPRRKPGITARLNRASPLASGLVGAWLFTEGSGGTRNLAGSADTLALDGGTWTVCGNGLAGANTGWNGFSNYAPSAAVRPAYLKTILWYGVLLGAATDLTDAPPLFAHYYDTSATSPYNCGSIHRYNDDLGLLFAWNNGAFGSQQVNAIAPGYNIPLQIALTLNGVQADGYLNGQAIFTGATGSVPTAGSPIQYGGTTFQTFGVHASAAVNANAAAYLILEWERALSAAELLAIAAAPYAVFATQDYYIVPGAPAAPDTPELYGLPHGVAGQRTMHQLLAQ